MAFNSDFNSSSPSDLLAFLCGLDQVTFEQIPLEQVAFCPILPFPAPDPLYQHEASSVEPLLDARQTDANDRLEIHAVASPALPPVASPPQSVAALPPNCYEIPQEIYSRNHWAFTPKNPILFRVNGHPGLNMYEALRGVFTGLDGRDDLVFQDAKKVFYCHFSFPGYPDKSYQIFAMRWNKNRDPIQLSKLGYHIAKKLKKYLDAMNTHPMDASTPQQWKIGEGYMKIQNVYLTGLESVSMGSYQPRFYVVDPTV